MKPIIEIRRNMDGALRVCKPDIDYPADFKWDDGLFLCNCNLGGFFAEAANEESPDEECGHDRYSVRITDQSGNVLYQDEDWVRASR